MSDPLTDFANSLTAANANNPVADVNDSERNGNIGDPLFNINQAALTVNTNINPQNVIGDLKAGKITLPVIILLAGAGLLLWWMFKK